MNTRNIIIRGFLAGMAAAMPHGSQASETSASAASGASAPAVMADGVIRKIDKDAKKITIKHGEIKNLEMPGMTMVFQVKDAALLEKVQVGDQVKFHAERQDGAMVVTVLQTAASLGAPRGSESMESR